MKGKERRPLTMHPNILRDIVFKQAGTREKAVLEGVMNAIDSGSTEIGVTIDSDKLVIEDDGRGFKTRDEIIKVFETFGTPHEEGDATFGKFRMGRGQLFAQGVNAWRSNEFLMTVDAKEELAYDLHSMHTFHTGCRIEVEWYEPLIPSAQHEIARELERMVKYVHVPITLNDRQLNTPPDGVKWDSETKQAYFKFTKGGSLAIYNLGVLVCNYPASKYGAAGTIVSKVQLDVNFARNDVMSDGKVWQAIERVIRKEAKDGRDEKVRSRTDLSDSELERACGDFMAGTLDESEVMSLKLFTDVTGQKHSLRSISRWFSQTGSQLFTHAPLRDRRGDRLMASQVALVFAEETFESFGIKNFGEILDIALYANRKDRKHESLYSIHSGSLWNVEFRKFETLAKTMNESQFLIPDGQLWPNAKLALEVLGVAQREILGVLNKGSWNSEERVTPRNLRIGKSDTAAAWTDGESYIAINESFFKVQVDRTLPDWAALGSLLLHEYLHSDSTVAGDMVHSPDFYIEFHNAAGDAIGRFVQTALTHYLRILQREGKSLARYVGRAADKVAKIKQAEARIDELQGRSQEAVAASAK